MEKETGDKCRKTRLKAVKEGKEVGSASKNQGVISNGKGCVSRP